MRNECENIYILQDYLRAGVTGLHVLEFGILSVEAAALDQLVAFFSVCSSRHTNIPLKTCSILAWESSESSKNEISEGEKFRLII